MKGFLGYFVFRRFHREEGGFSLALTQGPSKGFHGFFERVFGESPAPWFDCFGEQKALSIEDFGSAEKIKGLPCLFELRLVAFENLL